MNPTLRSATAVVFALCFLIPPAALGQAPEDAAAPRAAPDLLVVPGSYRISPMPPRVQDVCTVTITVLNQGDQNVAAAFYVSFYLNNTSTPMNRNNYRIRVSSLAAGASVNVSCTWDTRTSETVYFLPDINYTIIVLVDSGGVISEGDEGNNQFEQNQTLMREKWPDLRLVDFSLSPASLVRGDLATINATITNTGETAGKAFKVYLYLDHNTSEVISVVDVPMLNLSEVKYVKLFWNTTNYPPRTYNVSAIVNPEFYYTKIPELSWADNEVTKEAALQMPDAKLELLGFDLWPAEPHKTDQLTVNLSLRNNGSFDIEKLPILVFLDQEPIYNQSRDIAVGITLDIQCGADTSTMAEGEHTVRLLADKIDSSRSFALLPLRMADLVVRNLTVMPETPSIGDRLEFSFQVSNQGEARSGPCVASLYMEFVQGPVAGAGVPSLAPSEACNISLLWNTTGLSAGTQRLRLLVDSGYSVPERNETNNSCLLDIELGGQYDLALENLTTRPASPKVGETVQFSVRVRNRGTLSCGASNLSLELEGQEVDRRSIASIAAGGFLDTSVRWLTSGLAAANYSYKLLLELPDNLTDAVVANNLLSGHLELQSPPPAPDLRVAEIVLGAETPRVGGTLALGIKVENAGNRDAGGSSLMVFLENGTSLLRFTSSAVEVPPLQAGSSATLNVTRNTSSFRPGTYIINVTVDYNSEVAELNEANNHLSRELLLMEELPKKPSLKVEELLLEGALEEGSSVNLMAVVANTGDGEARDVLVTFIIDGQPVANRTIDSLAPGANRTVTYMWKATAGKHTFGADASAQDAGTAVGPARQAEVSAAPEVSEGASSMLPIAAAVAVIVACAAAAIFLIRRKKSSPARLEKEPEPMEEAPSHGWSDEEGAR